VALIRRDGDDIDLVAAEVVGAAAPTSRSRSKHGDQHQDHLLVYRLCRFTTGPRVHFGSHVERRR
jgi:hypothetical protein